MVKTNAKKPRNTVNVDAVKREVNKLVQASENSSPRRVAQESVRRQSPLEREMGTAKYRKMIHDHNEKNKSILDKLPFTFPKKKVVRSHLDILLVCPECDTELWGTENTVGIVCSRCKKYVNPRNPEAEARGYNSALKAGFRGTLSNKLELKEKLGNKNNIPTCEI